MTQSVSASESQMSAVFSTLADAVITTDHHRRILMFNRAAERLFRIDAVHVIGTSSLQFLPLSPTGQPTNIAVRADGEEFSVEISSSEVGVDEHLLSTTVVRDVSEQRQAEQALRDSEERFRTTFDQAAVGIAHIQLDGHWLSVNEKLCEIVGYTPAELVQLTFQDITHPDDLETDLAFLKQLLRGEIRTYSLQKRYFRNGGEQIWINLTVALVRSEDGSPCYFISVIEDIGDIKAAEAALRSAHDELESRVKERTAELQSLSLQLQLQVTELERHNAESRMLGEMSEMLQACLNLEEAQGVVAHHASRLFPFAAGALYAFGNSRNVLEEAVTWNGAVNPSRIFAPTECWGLRRGKTFVSAGLGLRCSHTASGPTLCVPLLAQSETVGLFHLVSEEGRPFLEHTQHLAQMVAETVALAFMNLRLRETLRQQSIRDPLTGLFNRRYLEETFERELRRATRHNDQIGIIMLDVDHFKRFNDAYGHEAGDVLLQELGSVLRTCIRGEDVACRYGGEEFALLLPGADLEQTLNRAEAVRNAVELMQVTSRGQHLGSVTLSLGVAAFPQHAGNLNDLLRAADLALYQAKQEGRNRSLAAAAS
ncbi:sensor domain-containing diguanylate cyclase [Deinococcus arenicola]|uniref:Diguanylate cyclase n=1 Tax=Deinococcus arenicola TaxID=2994950 RepID=A0ABU4DWB8_9DEIO|nr:diguanylate cyclase [Deinococcus sp. ZS9-10]MDV6376349.1 diguanylate cyclase [Deinococcus sp. ZS9-10]